MYIHIMCVFVHLSLFHDLTDSLDGGGSRDTQFVGHILQNSLSGDYPHITHTHTHTHTHSLSLSLSLSLSHTHTNIVELTTLFFVWSFLQASSSLERERERERERVQMSERVTHSASCSS